jgi:hypothetical protein
MEVRQKPSVFEPDRIIAKDSWHDARLTARFLLLGSSSLDLLDQAAESLNGRNRKLLLPVPAQEGFGLGNGTDLGQPILNP